MFTVRSRRGVAALSTAVVALAAFLAVTASSAAGATPPTGTIAGDPTGAGDSQSPTGRQPGAAGAGHEEPVPYVCRLYEQILPDEQRYRTTDNERAIYDVSTYGTNWFDVKCGHLTFAVPAGQEALVDLTAVAELDCGHTESPSVGGGWCGGRFLINGLPLPDPDNTGIEDSYAWDEATGGGYDYAAHTLAQVYKADCTKSTTGGPCYYRVQLQSRLEAGARSVWIDDLTMRVDVNEGKVTVTP
jgi:hypothetical protein